MPKARRYFRTEPFDHGEPLSRPHYGFMAAAVLVLLFGCLLASSNWVRAHVIFIDLPQPIGGPPEPLTLVSLSASGTITVNDKMVSDEVLRRVLELGLSDPIEPLTRFEPDANTSYRRVLEVLGIIKKSGISKFCFGNLPEFRIFHKQPQPLFLTILPPKEWGGPRTIPPPLNADEETANGCGVT